MKWTQKYDHIRIQYWECKIGNSKRLRRTEPSLSFITFRWKPRKNLTVNVIIANLWWITSTQVWTCKRSQCQWNKRSDHSASNFFSPEWEKVNKIGSTKWLRRTAPSQSFITFRWKPRKNLTLNVIIASLWWITSTQVELANEVNVNGISDQVTSFPRNGKKWMKYYEEIRTQK